MEMISSELACASDAATVAPNVFVTSRSLPLFGRIRQQSQPRDLAPITGQSFTCTHLVARHRRRRDRGLFRSLLVRLTGRHEAGYCCRGSRPREKHTCFPCPRHHRFCLPLISCPHLCRRGRVICGSGLRQIKCTGHSISPLLSRKWA